MNLNTKRRVLRKIYGPIQDKDGVWRIKTNEELEKLIQGKNIVRFIKAQSCAGWHMSSEWRQQKLSKN
jgi:hypothetical protein